MALLKFKKNTKWYSLYVNELLNRLRKDKNLSDVDDVAKSRENLGIFGDNNITHFHDSRYLPKIKALKEYVNYVINGFKIEISGRIHAAALLLKPNATNNIAVDHVNADDVAINAMRQERYFFTTAQKLGDQPICISPTTYIDVSGNTVALPNLNVAAINCSGHISADVINANKVWGAVWNDYAEFFPKGVDNFEIGDIIMLDKTSNKEVYIRATEHQPVVGVYTNEAATIIGGEMPPNNENWYKFNCKKYIPIALAGRIHVKFKGKAAKGMKVVASTEPGIGREFNEKTDSFTDIIGFLVEDDNRTDTRILRMKVQ